MAEVSNLQKIDIYDVNVLRKRRKEPADKIRTALNRRLLRIFSEAAERCGGVKRWAPLPNGVLEVDSGCAKFWYDPRSPIRSGIEAVLYGDMCGGNTREVEEILRRVVYELTFGCFTQLKNSGFSHFYIVLCYYLVVRFDASLNHNAVTSVYAVLRNR